MITYGARIISDNGYHVRFTLHVGPEGSKGLAASEVCLRKEEFEDMVQKLNMAVIRIETIKTEDFKKQFKEMTGFNLPEPGLQEVVLLGKSTPEREDLAQYLRKEGVTVTEIVGKSPEHLKKGDRVKFTLTGEPTSWGVSKYNAEHLTRGECYTVERVEAHSWHTKIFLQEFPGIEFNSVWFEVDV